MKTSITSCMVFANPNSNEENKANNKGSSNTNPISEATTSSSTTTLLRNDDATCTVPLVTVTNIKNTHNDDNKITNKSESPEEKKKEIKMNDQP